MKKIIILLSLFLLIPFVLGNCDFNYLNEKLSSCYNFEELSAPYKDYKNVSDFSISYNTPKRNEGFINYGINFTNNSFIKLNYSGVLSNSYPDFYERQDLTFSVFTFKPIVTTSDSYGVIFGKYRTTPNHRQYYFIMYKTSRLVEFGVNNGSTYIVDSTVPLPYDEWTMVSVSYDNKTPNPVNIYFNTSLVGAGNTSNMFDKNETLELASFGHQANDFYLDTSMDIFRVFNTTLNQSCINLLYNLTVYEKQTCTFNVCYPDWVCNGYGNCTTQDLKFCNNVTDLNFCNKTYTGDYSEFNNISCDYCIPEFECYKYGVCKSGEKICTNTTDNKNCYSQTNLTTDLYNGDFSEFENKFCGLGLGFFIFILLGIWVMLIIISYVLQYKSLYIITFIYGIFLSISLFINNPEIPRLLTSIFGLINGYLVIMIQYKD